jgi:hypothetical protein
MLRFNKKALQVSVVVGVTSLLGVWLAFRWLESKISPAYNANECERNIRARINPDTLRSWALQYIQKEATNALVRDHSLRELGTIWDKGPPWAGVFHDEGVEPYVEVGWGGGGIGHWGLWVGSTNFILPENYHFETTRHLWKPGIYFWENFH